MRLARYQYETERRRHQTALRMIRHAARTQTILRCTGLTDDRIRKLYRTYVHDPQRHDSHRRKRGKSPTNIDCVLHNSATHREASLLAGMLLTSGALDSSRACAQPNLEFAELLCDAFEMYLRFADEDALTLEHAWFLRNALCNGDDLELATCSRCGGLAVQDRYAPRARPCPWCHVKRKDARLRLV